MNKSKLSANRTALVTGGSHGIGFAIAKKFVIEGITTIIADTEESAETIPKEINFIYCDVSKGADVDQMFAEVQINPGLPDILICNAGRGIHEKLSEGDPGKWQQVFDINIMGTLRCIRAFVPEMLKKKNGDVVIISSVSANQPYTYGGVYAASKTALEVIAETLRIETSPDIRVTVVAPGATNTGFFNHMVAGHQSLDDIGFKAISPNEIADCVWFAINKPKEVSINYITVRPTPQIF